MAVLVDGFFFGVFAVAAFFFGVASVEAAFVFGGSVVGGSAESAAPVDFRTFFFGVTVAAPTWGASVAFRFVSRFVAASSRFVAAFSASRSFNMSSNESADPVLFSAGAVPDSGASTRGAMAGDVPATAKHTSCKVGTGLAR